MSPAAEPAPAQPTALPRAEPAFRAFAAAMFEAVWRRDDEPLGGSILTGAQAITAAPVTAPVASAPLDMTQSRWPHAMVERIERLRDEADAGDTRIRLVPEALGAIDVSLRRDGDMVHVAFHADQAETRQILAEARPELAMLAETRGLKLGETAIVQGPATGTGHSGAHHSGSERTPRHHQPAAPPPSPRRAADAVEEPGDDIRIA